jgi:hypothetical protein
VDIVRPPLVGLITLAYRDAGRALWALRELALTAGLIGVAHSLAQKILYTPGFARATGATGRDLAALMLAAGWIFLLVPFMIAVHRFVLLGETETRYSVERKNPRTQRFFGSWMALLLVAAMPGPIVLSGLAALQPLDWWIWLVLLPLVVLPIVLSLRMTLLFPAIAVDAPGATWARAYQDSKGHSVRICLVYVAASVPAIAAAVVCRALLVLGHAALAAAGVPGQVLAVSSTLIAMAISNALYVGWLALMVVIASRLYQLLGDRVRHRSEPQSA